MLKKIIFSGIICILGLATTACGNTPPIGSIAPQIHVTELNPQVIVTDAPKLEEKTGKDPFIIDSGTDYDLVNESFVSRVITSDTPTSVSIKVQSLTSNPSFKNLTGDFTDIKESSNGKKAQKFLIIWGKDKKLPVGDYQYVARAYFKDGTSDLQTSTFHITKEF